MNWGLDVEAATRPVWIDAAALPPGAVATMDDIAQVLQEASTVLLVLDNTASALSDLRCLCQLGKAVETRGLNGLRVAAPAR